MKKQDFSIQLGYREHPTSAFCDQESSIIKGLRGGLGHYIQDFSL